MQSTIRDDINAIHDKTQATAQEVKSRATHAIAEAKDDIYNMANEAGRKVRSVLSGAKNDVEGVTETVTTAIRNKPVQSSLIALGVGYVLASLLRR